MFCTTLPPQNRLPTAPATAPPSAPDFAPLLAPFAPSEPAAQPPSANATAQVRQASRCVDGREISIGKSPVNVRRQTVTPGQVAPVAGALRQSPALLCRNRVRVYSRSGAVAPAPPFAAITAPDRSRRLFTLSRSSAPAPHPYQIRTRRSGARYSASVGVTPYAAYHGSQLRTVRTRILSGECGSVVVSCRRIGSRNSVRQFWAKPR